VKASKPGVTTRVTTSRGKIYRRPPSRKRACLIQYTGDALGRRYVLEGSEVTLGRGAANGIVILDVSVSRDHARFYSRHNAIEIEDLNSSNGTFINDMPVRTRTALRDGDMVRLGSIQFKFFAHDNVESVFHDQIYRMATIDAGTQIFNRNYLLETLESAFNYSRSYDRPLSVVYYDLDYFKKINDAYGHSCGDYVLRESAQVAKACLRKDDVIGRLGGEEFLVVLPNANARKGVELADRIRESIERHDFVFEGKRLVQTISIGVSEMQPAFKTYTDLLDDADRKLYQSKNDGRNRVTA
jgi:diguanylate cyclase (GGDEF)-like protein